MDILSFKEKLFTKAKSYGFSECEIFYYFSKNTSISIFKGELEKFQNNSSCGISFRGIFNGKMGYSYTECISNKSIDRLVNQAMQNAQIITSKDQEFIYEGSPEYPNIKNFYQNIENVTTDDMLKKCLEMEGTVLAYSSLITSCNSCSITKTSTETFISNTKGLNLTDKSNTIISYISAIAKDRGQLKTFSDFNISFDFNNFDHIEFAKSVAKGATSYLGATTIKSGSYNTVIENRCFADLLEGFSSNFYAENVQKGFSLLKGKLGEKIASPKITIIDAPLLEKAYCSSTFDSEGVACFNKEVIKNGVLKTYLYNLKSANNDNVKSTGNGFKSSYKATTSTSTTNFYIESSDTSLTEVLNKAVNGVFITNLSGLHSGINSISGDFSLLAEGFNIKDGKLDTPLEQITIAGNFYDILKNIQLISNDLKFNSSSIGSPSIFVGKLSISGD